MTNVSKLCCLISFLASVCAFAMNPNIERLPDDLAHAPNPVVIEGIQYVPLDILENRTTWLVSPDLKQVSARSNVRFQVASPGYPFLLLNPGSEVKLNGISTAIKNLTHPPFQKSSFFALNSTVYPERVYEFESRHSFNISEEDAFFLPLKYWSHSHVERGIPCNTHQDHFPLTLNIQFQGDSSKIKIFTNAKVSSKRPGKYELVFPEKLTSSSFYIDIQKEQDVLEKRLELTSVDGRKIPVLVYAEKRDEAKRYVNTYADIISFSFPVLEKQFGPYPYEKIIFKSIDESTGGAYAGAMALDPRYLDAIIHELGHSWFSHSVSPASGHDHWIYEGLGHWAPVYRTGPAHLDKTHEQFADLTEDPLDLWKPNWAPFDGHLSGSVILGALDKKIRDTHNPFRDQGLIGVLKEVHTRMKGKTMSTDQFRILLNQITGINFDPQFDFYFKNYRRWEN